MSSERFEYAGDELEGQLEKLDSALRQLDHVKDAEEARKRNKQVCEKCFESGENLLEEMESEARSAPLQYRAEMLASVRSYRSRLQLLRMSYRSAMKAGPLRGNSASKEGHFGPGDGLREKVLDGMRSLDRTGESIERAQQVSLETEEVGGAIIEDLGTQRESLERTRNRLIDTDLEIGRSKKILKKMYFNVISNKLILVCIILIELGILIGLVYWKYFSK